MKNIKRLSLLLATFIILSSVFCITVFAEENEAFIVDTDTVYAEIPDGYEFYPYYDCFYFSNDNVDSIHILQAKNFNVQNGVKKLTQESAFDLYKYYFSIDTKIYDYKIAQSEVEKVNGISAYVISGEYILKETENKRYDEEGNDYSDIVDYWSSYFSVHIFATKENVIIIQYESSGEKEEQNLKDNKVLMETVLINGTYFYEEKLSVSHNFTNSQSFEDSLQTATDSYDPFSEIDDEMWAPFFAVIFIFFAMPVLLINLVAVVNIVKYSKNKKKLKQYELTYGGIPQYNAFPQNYGEYGYNQPINQPYQPPVNPAYQQNPVNQNAPQTPSYVTNAVENLNEQINQTQQPVQAPEIQVTENNESAGE